MSKKNFLSAFSVLLLTCLQGCNSGSGLSNTTKFQGQSVKSITSVLNSTVLTIEDLESNYEKAFCSAKTCSNNIQFIKSQPQAGYFDLAQKPILNNHLNIKQLKFESIAYTTEVELGGSKKSFSVSGGLILPQIDKSKLKGVIVYFHGTTFNKASVPSNYNLETQLTAEVFAANGYIVVSPDYVGQGKDWQSVHPYVLYPKVSAKTAADMLISVNDTIKNEYNLSDGDQLKLFSTGYSEGGAYALWFNSFINEDHTVIPTNYKLTHSIGMEGAYNTSEVTKGFLFNNVAKNASNDYQIQSQDLTNMVKPLLSADAFLSYATYEENGNYNNVFNMEFFNMNCGVMQAQCNIDKKHLDIATAFKQSNTTVEKQFLVSAFNKKSNGATYMNAEQYAKGSTANDITALVSQSLMSSVSQQKLDNVLQAANVNLSDLGNDSVSIISLSNDSVVTPNNFDKLLELYPSKIKNAIKIDQTNIKVPSLTDGAPISVDHLQAPVYEYLYALNIFNQY